MTWIGLKLTFQRHICGTFETIFTTSYCQERNFSSLHDAEKPVSAVIFSLLANRNTLLSEMSKKLLIRPQLFHRAVEKEKQL